MSSVFFFRRILLTPKLTYKAVVTVFVQGIFLRGLYGEREEYRKPVCPEVSKEETPCS